MNDNSKELDELKKTCMMLFASEKSLDEKKDDLWNLPEEELIILLEQFDADNDHEICCAIRAVLDEKKLDPGGFQYLGLE